MRRLAVTLGIKNAICRYKELSQSKKKETIETDQLRKGHVLFVTTLQECRVENKDDCHPCGKLRTG